MVRDASWTVDCGLRHDGARKFKYKVAARKTVGDAVLKVFLRVVCILMALQGTVRDMRVQTVVALIVYDFIAVWIKLASRSVDW